MSSTDTQSTAIDLSRGIKAITKADMVNYLDVDVVTEAKNRIKKVIGMFDHVVVSFSGGKDSLAVLELTRRVYDELGMKDVPVDVVFRDEELIPDDVIAFVTKYYHDPRYRMRYYAVPMKSRMFMLGELRPYVQWDPEREWVRQKPDFAITQLHPDNLPLSQEEMNPLIYKGWTGKIAVLNGIRASESLTRFQSCVSKRGRENYIVGDSAKNVCFIKPIFDWEEIDVFKFFEDYQVPYCHIYEKEMYAMAPLRVATPLHEQAFQLLSRLRIMYPVFYQQLCNIFPETRAHVTYWPDVDRMGVMDQYPKSFEGITQFIMDTINDPKSRRTALSELSVLRQSKENNRRNSRYTRGGCYGYPLQYVFQKFIKGDYLKRILPKPKPSDSDIAYEREAEREAHEAISGR